MKNIKKLIFFSLFLFVSLKFLAQELRQDIYEDRQNLITKTCTDFKHLVDGFDFVREKYPVVVSFANFLEENLSHDEQEANYGEVLSEAQDFICESVKEPFLDIFNQACARPDQLREEPLWKYVAAHKDGFMRLSICEWMNLPNQDFDTKLHDAVSKNDLSKVDMLLQWHCNPNLKNKDGLSPLHIAVKNKSLGNIRMLLASGADVNVQDNEKKMPLMYITGYRYSDIALMLLKEKIDVNIQDETGYTPLHYAAIFGLNDELIKSASNINIQEKEKGYTALHIAVTTNNSVTCGILLQAGADVNVQDKEGCTPLMHAIVQGNLDITLMLLKEKVDINISYDGITYMHLAAFAGRNQEIDLLIQSGGKVDVLDNNGRTPLHVAMQCDDRDKIEGVVLSLINAKANVNIQDEEGLTPLHYAAAIQGAICHYSNSVNHLIKAGAALNTQEESLGLTPLHIALRKNNVVAFCMLLEAGAKFDIKDKAGETIEQELVKGSAMQLNFDRIRKQRGEK